MLVDVSEGPCARPCSCESPSLSRCNVVRYFLIFVSLKVGTKIMYNVAETQTVK